MTADTSREAHAARRRHTLALVAARLAKARRKGATCDELEVALGLPHQTAGPRIRDLVLGGVVVDGGARRLTRGKRRAAVWVLAKYGDQAPRRPRMDALVREWREARAAHEAALKLTPRTAESRAADYAGVVAFNALTARLERALKATGPLRLGGRVYRVNEAVKGSVRVEPAPRDARTVPIPEDSR